MSTTREVGAGDQGCRCVWGAGAPSARGPHLGQGFDAHQIHEADPAQVEDEGVEADEGRDAGQQVGGLSGGLSRRWGLAVGGGGAVRAEGDIGHTGPIGRCLVVVGVGWGGVLKVLLQLLQGDSLEEGWGGGWSRGSAHGSRLPGAGAGPRDM